MVASIIKENRLSPILKWAGGKEQELKYIHPCLPKKINNYYEPFIGGGAVYFSVDANKMFINDKSHELINLYNAISIQDKKFFSVVEEMMHNWKLLENIITNNKTIFIDTYKEFSNDKKNEEEVKNWVTSFVLKHSKDFNGMFDTNFNVNIDNFLKEIKKNINSKMKRMKKIELDRGELPDNDIVDNMESALKSAFYMHFRYLYNNIKKYKIEHSFAVAIFFFIRNFAYSGMFRYNKDGGFNVPYGGIGYNRKNLAKKVDYLKTNELIEHLNKTVIDNLDFEDFFKKNKPKKDDFIFLDPPYDSEFSTYAQNEFTRNDQIRLANYLINDCEANWMMVIKNTDFIYDLYNKDGIYMTSFDKKYLVSFQNRNDKDVEHLLITNYKIEK
ncbi:DNA adenine methylase [Aliarcobacter skirrowii]|uniref:DNA adenine methylase n=1 Tax=Aliarcobacter skirrowii TaxID=28200 RepID=UPI000D61ADED|nr:DNA adenine methylase [Aliarcobacter skirrowii]PWE20336.1 DNA adenine methylase [Aliarcobacter skirrowii]PWE24687.1 DNA adenine methylase [Aliarcobacter skirrowii]RJO55667.1 DNA adenine methylase [Aliarcobacter skirrowii]RJO57623.1 DNA adenine methylase [Aliarcobacter skirrowii]